MKKRLIFWTVVLIAVLLSSACSPAVLSTSTAPIPNIPALPSATQTLETTTQSQVPSEAPTLTIQPAATSRGPNLEATDPTTVALASEGLQLVEFFRFT